MLRRAGWEMIPGGKGSHTKWKHARVARTITLSGKDGSDARRYQERDVERGVEEAEQQ